MAVRESARTSSAGQRRLGRIAPKTDPVIAALRAEVVRGILKPGEKLPTWDEMEKRFRVGRPTLMRALERLKEDGLIVADSTRGTYVAQRPPHLYRYALAFPQGPGQNGWNRFWAALDTEAAVVAHNQSIQIATFYWVDAHPDNESYARLVREARAGRLTGVVCVAGTWAMDAAAVERLGVPVVVVQSGQAQIPGIPVIDSDYNSFVKQSLRWLQQRGRKHPAVLTNVHNAKTDFIDRLKDYGMSAKACWLQGVDTVHPSWAGQIVRLLMDPANTEKPDSLIITDDNIAEPALRALVEMGVRVPQDLDIVTHSNATWPVSSIVPTLRLGFDGRRMIEMAVEALERLRQHQAVPPTQLLSVRELS